MSESEEPAAVKPPPWRSEERNQDPKKGLAIWDATMGAPEGAITYRSNYEVVTAPHGHKLENVIAAACATIAELCTYTEELANTVAVIQAQFKARAAPGSKPTPEPMPKSGEPEPPEGPKGFDPQHLALRALGVALLMLKDGNRQRAAGTSPSGKTDVFIYSAAAFADARRVIKSINLEQDLPTGDMRIKVTYK